MWRDNAREPAADHTAERATNPATPNERAANYVTNHLTNRAASNERGPYDDSHRRSDHNGGDRGSNNGTFSRRGNRERCDCTRTDPVRTWQRGFRSTVDHHALAV